MKTMTQTQRWLVTPLAAATVMLAGLAPTASAKKPPPPPPDPPADAPYTAEYIAMAGFGINDAGQVVGSRHNNAALLTPADCDGDGDLDWFCDDGYGGNSLIEDLETLFPGDHSACGEAVNESGQMVGYSTGEDTHAFIWDASNGMVALGTLGGDESYSWAYDINASGQVVGQATSDIRIPDDDSYYRHAFVWENGAMVDLGTLGGVASAAYAINDAGQVVGVAQNSAGLGRAFVIEADNGVWFRDTSPADGINDLMIDLGTLGGDESAAWDINDLGQIVGWAQDGKGKGHPFLCAAGAMSSLGTLLPEGSAHILNNVTQILGTSTKSRGGTRPTGASTIRINTFWENGEPIAITDLVDTDLGYWGAGEDINDSGQFVTYGGYILHPSP